MLTNLMIAKAKEIVKNIDYEYGASYIKKEIDEKDS